MQNTPTLHAMLLSKNKVSRIVYDMFIQDESRVLKYMKYWEDLEFRLNNENYLWLFKELYICTKKVKYHDFMYRLLLCKLVFNNDLFQWGKKGDDLCTFCTACHEDIVHCFYECNCVKEMVKIFYEYFVKEGLNMPISREQFILNNFEFAPNHICTFIVVAIKQYLYSCRCQNVKPSKLIMESEIEYIYRLKIFYAEIENKVGKIEKKWRPIFGKT